MCRYELTLLRALCARPEAPTPAELGVILAYLGARAEGRFYDEAAVAPYLADPPPSAAELDRAALRMIRRLDRATLPPFRQAAVILAGVAGTPIAVAAAWERCIERAIDEQERSDAALLREQIAGEGDERAPG